MRTPKDHLASILVDLRATDDHDVQEEIGRSQLAGLLMRNSRDILGEVLKLAKRDNRVRRCLSGARYYSGLRGEVCERIDEVLRHPKIGRTGKENTGCGMSSTMSEEQLFLEEIDCRFPYHDRERCQQLIRRGLDLSPNAAIGVLHEICRPPRSVPVARKCLEILVEDWRAQFNHPLANLLTEVAISIIAGHPRQIRDVIEMMRIVSIHKGLYAALAILHFACDDPDGELEAMDQLVRGRWTAGHSE